MYNNLNCSLRQFLKKNIRFMKWYGIIKFRNFSGSEIFYLRITLCRKEIAKTCLYVVIAHNMNLLKSFGSFFGKTCTYQFFLVLWHYATIQCRVPPAREFMNWSWTWTSLAFTAYGRSGTHFFPVMVQFVPQFAIKVKTESCSDRVHDLNMTW